MEKVYLAGVLLMLSSYIIHISVKMISFCYTFFQGPHIASVTLAAWECGTLDFPEPPYPDE